MTIDERFKYAAQHLPPKELFILAIMIGFDNEVAHILNVLPDYANKCADQRVWIAYPKHRTTLVVTMLELSTRNDAELLDAARSTLAVLMDTSNSN